MTQQPINTEPGHASGGVSLSGGLGASLRGLRQARGWEVSDISVRLKFSPRQIEALEAEEWSVLPSGPSLRGLIRNYARLLEVDPDALLQAAPELVRGRGPTPSLAPLGGAGPLPYTSMPRRQGRGLWRVLILLMLLALVAAIGAYLVFEWWLPRQAASANGEAATASAPAVTLLDDRGTSTESVAPPVVLAPPVVAPTTPTPGASDAAPEAAAGATPPADAAVVAVPGADNVPVAPPSDAPSAAAVSPAAVPPAAVPPTALPAATETAPAAAPAAVASANALVFTVKDASWVEVRDAAGTIVLSATLQPNEQRTLEAAAPLRVVVGNASGVGLSWRGNPVDLITSQRGNVARLTLE